GRITVKFHNPLFVGEEVEVIAEIKENRRKIKITKAEMKRTSDGKKIAEAEAIMFVKRENR
ncbi:MAG: hotdog fold domain-containing protein, partial [Desulfurobacteriaceae bacterium]